MVIKRWSVSAALIAVLTAFFLALLHLEAPAAHAKAAAPAVSPRSYGSGTLGSWQGNNHVITDSAAVRETVKTDRTVYWVDVQVSRTDEPAAVQVADQRNSEWINLQLEQAALQHPNLRIVHWAEFLAASPDRLHTDLRDGRHTTVPAGQSARNTLILQAIRHS